MPFYPLLWGTSLLHGFEHRGEVTHHGPRTFTSTVTLQGDDLVATRGNPIMEERLGYDEFHGYDHWVWMYPYEIPDCPWSGYALIGGGKIWMQSKST